MIYSTTIQILNSLTISASFQLQLHSCIKISQQGIKTTKTFLETKKKTVRIQQFTIKRTFTYVHLYSCLQ